MLSHSSSDAKKLADLRKTHVVCRQCKIKAEGAELTPCPECGAAMRRPTSVFQEGYRTMTAAGAIAAEAPAGDSRPRLTTVPPSPPASGKPVPIQRRCVYCQVEGDEDGMRGDGINKFCSDQAACSSRVRARSGVVQPRLDGQPKATKTPAELVLAMMQERANVSTLSGPIQFGDNLSLPIIAAQAREVIFGASGCGKTHKSCVIAENCLINSVPVAILDKLGNLWGVRAPGQGHEGFPIVIVGGNHGDIVLGVDDAEALANIFAAGTSMLIDLSLLDPDEQHYFEAAFFRRLLAVLRTPAHVIVEEAESTCPAFAGEGKAHFAVQRASLLFFRQIRNFGVGWTLSTQDMNLLHPNATGSANVFLAMQSTGHSTQSRIRREARSRVGQVIADAIFSELGMLDQGEAWLIPNPNWLGDKYAAPIRYRVRERLTYDSSEVPRIGVPMKAPPKLVAVSLKAFKAFKAAA